MQPPIQKKSRWVICDIDGTLADSSWRATMLPDWDAFHRASVDDKPFDDTVHLLNVIHESRATNIAIITGRSEKYRNLTNEWLIRNNVPYTGLYMRADNDFSKSGAFKVGVVEKHFVGRHVWLILEDDDKCVDAYRSAGLTCHQVRPGVVS